MNTNARNPLQRTATAGPTAAIALLAAAIALAAPDTTLAQGGPPPALVRLDPVLEQSVETRRGITGNLRAVRDAAVASEEPGRVVELLVDEGDLVDQGDPIARLDTALIELEAEQIMGEIAAHEALARARRADVRQAELDLERLQRAADRAGVSANEVEDARVALDGRIAQVVEAEADARAARARLSRVRERINRMTTVAPFAGQVINVHTELGEWIAEGGTVADLVSLERIDAWLEVPESIIASVRRSGEPVELRIAALPNTTIASNDIAIVNAADPLARTFPVRVRLDNPANALAPGMSVTALLPTGTTNAAVTVHKDALLRDDAGSFVYFDAGGTAMPARVERLWATGQRVAIRSQSLAPGMRVVIEGNERLFPSQPINDIGASTPAARDNNQPQPRAEEPA